MVCFACEFSQYFESCSARQYSGAGQKERELTVEVLHHFREIERRLLYAERGYPSLFEYAVRELKYSPGAAH